MQAERALRGEAGQPADDWNFYALVPGTPRVADAVLEDLRGALAPLCLSSGAFRGDLGGDPFAELPPFLHPLVRPLLGSPDAESIKLIYALTSTPLPAEPLDLDVDRTPFGMKCCIPVIPPDGAHARRVAEIVSKIRAQAGVEVKLSIFGDGRTLITIHFRTDDPDQVRRAEACERALWNALEAAGFPPYRVSIDQMQRLVETRPGFFDLVAQLKSVLDPNSIISPGRYCAVSPHV